MFKPGETLIYIGPSLKEVPLKQNDFCTCIQCNQCDCGIVIVDIGLKIPKDKYAEGALIICPCGKGHYSKTFLFMSEVFRRPSEIEAIMSQVNEALKAPTPIKKFIIKTAEEYDVAIAHLKLYFPYIKKIKIE